MRDSFWSRPYLDAGLLVNIAGITSHLRDADPLYYFRTVDGTPFEVTDSIAFIEQDTASTNFLVCSYRDTVVFFLDGTQGQTNSLNAAIGYTQGQTGTYGFGEARGFSQGVDSILARTPPSMYGGKSTVYVVGHSFGGAIGCCLFLKMLQLLDTTNGRLWTFGSPRPGNSDMQRLLGQQFVTRIYTSQDPVPQAPPHTEESPTLGVISPAAVIRNINSQVQPPAGFALSAFGILSQVESLSALSNEVVLSLGNWLASSECFGNPLHAITEYVRLLQLYQGQQPPVPKRPTAAQLTQPEERTRRRANQEDVVGNALIVADKTDPLGNTQTYQIPAKRNVPNQRYRRKKYGKHWVVEFAGEIVGVGPGKRAAGALARRYNRATLPG